MLSRPHDFAAIQERGASRSHPIVSARFLRTDLETTRIGLATGRRLGTAVVRNRVRRRLRETVPLDSVAEPHSNGLLPDELHDLRAAVLGLPPRYREAVVLRHVQGFNYDEIAEVLGVPSGTAKSDVHRGLAILKEELR